MSEHPERTTILMYVESDPSIDRASIAGHIAECAECQALMEEFQHIASLLSDRDVWEQSSVADLDRAALRETLLREIDEFADERSSADAVFADLRALPIGTWDAFFEQHPEHRTGGMARRLLEEAEVELNRRPEYAILLVDVAERIGSLLPDMESRSVLGDAWKHRSNALRHLGRYDEALDAAVLAESFYVSLIAGDFDIAQAQYTRAVTLFKMTRYAEARKILAIATGTLQTYGDTVPLAKTMMLNAGVSIEEGDIAAAQEQWRAVLPLLDRLGDHVEQARVLANLAECNLRLGAFDQALEDAKLAVVRYRVLRMEAESIRSEWTIGMVHLARGESDDGRGVLENAAAAFEARGMAGDAGFVKLDLCEELLRREEWIDAEVTACELAALFTAAHVTMASVKALDYLRQAVANREATAETVRYVREYVTADNTSRPFDPPPTAMN